MKQIKSPALFIMAISLCVACQKTDEQPLISRLEVVTAKDHSDQTIEDSFPPILHVEGWQEPVPLAGPINTSGGEDSPFFDAATNTMYFFFTPNTQLPAEQQLGDGLTGIYSSILMDEGWSEPQRVWLNPQGGYALDGCPTMSGNTLWFCSIREGNYRSIDFWKVTLIDGTWQNIHNAGVRLNLQVGVGELDINKSQTEIIFHANLPGGKGENDLWATDLKDGKWSEPYNLTTINSEADDSRPFLSMDGQELWFTRTYQGSPAIYCSQWDGEQWGSPELVISQLAGEPTLDPEGNIYFVHHFVRDGSIVDADIYIAIKK